MTAEDTKSDVQPDGFLPYSWNVITPEMAAEAAKNINDTEATKKKGLKEMREILQSDSDLKFTDEDEVLLVFLRSRKFNGKRAAEFFMSMLKYVENYRYLLERKEPEVLRRVMRTNMVGFLPYRDAKGRPIVYARTAMMAPETPGDVPSYVPPEGFLPYSWNIITPAMRATAAKNINETEETRAKGLKEMREILRSDPDLEFTDKDEILLVFLRVRKFDGKRAAEFFKTGLKYVDSYRYLLERKDSAVLRRVMRENMIGFLPYRDAKGRAIIYTRADAWDYTVIPAWDAIWSGLVTIRSAGDNEVNQMHGFVVLLDLQGLKIQQVIAMSKWMIFGTLTLQRVLPCFLKAFHVVNIPPFYKIGWKIVKPLLTDKVRNRFIFHKSSDLSSLYEHIPPEILPPELGGKLGPFTNDHWASDSQLDAMEKKYYEQLSTNGYISKRKKATSSKSSKS